MGYPRGSLGHDRFPVPRGPHCLDIYLAQGASSQDSETGLADGLALPVAAYPVGMPMAFQTSIIAIGTVILQVALNGLGPISVAAFSAAQKVETIA